MRRPHPLRLAAEEDQSYQEVGTDAGGIHRGGRGDRLVPKQAPSGEANPEPDKLYVRLATAVDAAVTGLDPAALAHAIRQAEAVEPKLAKRLVLRATLQAQDAGDAQIETLRRALQELVDERRRSQN